MVQNPKISWFSCIAHYVSIYHLVPLFSSKTSVRRILVTMLKRGSTAQHRVIHQNSIAANSSPLAISYPLSSSSSISLAQLDAMRSSAVAQTALLRRRRKPLQRCPPRSLYHLNYVDFEIQPRSVRRLRSASHSALFWKAVRGFWMSHAHATLITTQTSYYRCKCYWTVRVRRKSSTVQLCGDWRVAIWRWLARSAVRRERACTSRSRHCTVWVRCFLVMINCLSCVCITHFANLVQNVHAALWFCPVAKTPLLEMIRIKNTNHVSVFITFLHIILQNWFFRQWRNAGNIIWFWFYYIWNETIYWRFRHASFGANLGVSVISEVHTRFLFHGT